ncbi:hypothetical protein SAMN04489844_1885 [Nocardioides exalbidus]|uniref:Uncharacterized protein n=1 Tax=Nocardioides exalbidus TaxID=402596 RepID=A0A1H4QNS1_9ACTN|nr:hypothetical protein [Nocardioides exalbidus]SEC21286.1 hypothetical protein SAMN04489844_1885 [Nocardioides exalbidus]
MTSGEGVTTLVHQPTPTARADWDEWYGRRWRIASLALVLLLVAIGGTAFVAGEKQSTYGDLVGAVVDGDAQQVEIHGPRDGGPGTYVVRWRETINHYAEVRVVRGKDSQLAVDSPGIGGREYVDEAPADFLRGLAPWLSVDTTGNGDYVRWTLMGWSGPAALSWMLLAAGLAVFVLIVSGPPPWRSTRWAWFWMFALASPIGLVAYVVLAGPLAHLRPADPSRRRLTGGWAFLLATFVLSAFVGYDRTWQ